MSWLVGICGHCSAQPSTFMVKRTANLCPVKHDMYYLLGLSSLMLSWEAATAIDWAEDLVPSMVFGLQLSVSAYLWSSMVIPQNLFPGLQCYPTLWDSPQPALSCLISICLSSWIWCLKTQEPFLLLIFFRSTKRLLGPTIDEKKMLLKNMWRLLFSIDFRL